MGAGGRLIPSLGRRGQCLVAPANEPGGISSDKLQEKLAFDMKYPNIPSLAPISYSFFHLPSFSSPHIPAISVVPCSYLRAFAHAVSSVSDNLDPIIAQLIHSPFLGP